MSPPVVPRLRDAGIWYRMNEIKSLVLLSKLVSWILSCSTEELKIPLARASEERLGRCTPMGDCLDPRHLIATGNRWQSATAMPGDPRNSGLSRESPALQAVPASRTPIGGEHCRSPQHRVLGVDRIRPVTHCVNSLNWTGLLRLLSTLLGFFRQCPQCER